MDALLTHKGRGTIENPVNTSKGCGGVMRAAPIGFLNFDHRTVFQCAAMSAALTHGHPSGYLSAGALALIIHQIARIGLRPAAAVETALVELRNWNDHEETYEALERALTCDVVGMEGWTGEEALAMAVCSVVRSNTMRDCLRAAVNHSGDSDSTGSIAGQIYGAWRPDELPWHWATKLDAYQVIVDMLEGMEEVIR